MTALTEPWAPGPCASGGGEGGGQGAGTSKVSQTEGPVVPIETKEKRKTEHVFLRPCVRPRVRLRVRPRVRVHLRVH